ncbi:hypothetical protein AVEN_189959-1, partial [Araneus ventricosus]
MKKESRGSPLFQMICTTFFCSTLLNFWASQVADAAATPAPGRAAFPE